MMKRKEKGGLKWRRRETEFPWPEGLSSSLLRCGIWKLYAAELYIIGCWGMAEVVWVCEHFRFRSEPHTVLDMLLLCLLTSRTFVNK